jgi:hypothetical protein
VTVRRVLVLGGVVALVASGVYVFVYLYRWEWNRALMAGVLFVAAEVALLAIAVMKRLDSMEKKIADHSRDVETHEVLDKIRETALPPPRRFEWLNRRGGDLNVFIPVLLGAGVIASGLAWVIERVARVTVRPGLERNLASRLRPFVLPPTPLLDGSFAGLAPSPESVSPGDCGARLGTLPRALSLRSTMGPIRKIVAGALVASLGVMAVDALADATQSRVDPLIPNSRTALVLEVFSRNERITSLRAATTLWGICEGSLQRPAEGRLSPSTGGRVHLELRPSLGEHDLARLHGCFEDALIDQVQARVVSAQVLLNR